LEVRIGRCVDSLFAVIWPPMLTVGDSPAIDFAAKARARSIVASAAATS
jgi:hypothetical protein